MLKVEKPNVFGVADALRGMRNPLNSWSKGDSTCRCSPEDGHVLELNLGPNDAKLCSTLVRGGSPHRKFLRQIHVTMDIVAPAYWWAEMDTYKVSTTRDSCSLQHKGSVRDFETSDFSLDDSPSTIDPPTVDGDAKVDLGTILSIVNKWRRKYIETKDYTYFRIMRQLLPMGYNYRATWSGNYEVLYNIFQWRHNHRLAEWHELCDVIMTLPGARDFLGTLCNER